MQKEFTHDFMRENSGCYAEEDILDDCSFMSKPVVSLQDILESEIPLKDKYWFVCKKLATKEQNQRITIGVAEIMLVIYEQRRPGDKRPHEAVKAARDYLAGTIGFGELITKRAAARDAAFYSCGAASAAYVATWAVDPSACASSSACDAVDDAVYIVCYAKDEKIKAELLEFLKQICEI